jgi:hypothetical protein
VTKEIPFIKGMAKGLKRLFRAEKDVVEQVGTFPW